MTEVGRRQVLAGFAAIGAAGLVGRGRATTPRPVFGVNSVYWSTVNAAIGGGIKGERCDYPLNATPPVPPSWFRTGSSVTAAVGGFRPPIAATIAGQLDAQLHAFAAQVPAGCAVTAWHEGEEAGPHGAHVPAATLLKLHAHCHAIFHAAGVKYVQIVGCYSQYRRGSALPHYISPVVDAVYLDGYQLGSETVKDIFGAPAAAITSACGPSMPRGITETNSHNVRGRPAWFADTYAYAQANNHEIYSVFWTSGPHIGWLPNDTATIAALKKINTG